MSFLGCAERATRGFACYPRPGPGLVARIALDTKLDEDQRADADAATRVGKEQDRASNVPRRRRIVAFDLPPERTLAEALTWISSVVGKEFLVPDTIARANTTLTMVAPQRIT